MSCCWFHCSCCWRRCSARTSSRLGSGGKGAGEVVGNATGGWTGGAAGAFAANAVSRDFGLGWNAAALEYQRTPPAKSKNRAHAQARSLNPFQARCAKSEVWGIIFRGLGSGSTEPSAIISWQWGQLTHSPNRPASKFIGPLQTGHNVLRRSSASIKDYGSWFSSGGQYTT
jgi:hypothetical protein